MTFDLPSQEGASLALQWHSKHVAAWLNPTVMHRRTAISVPLVVIADGGRHGLARGAAPRKPARIGLLTVEPEDFSFFAKYLKQAGLEEGRDFVLVQQRAARSELLLSSARALVSQAIDLIVAPSTQETRAAQQATRTIPIVMLYGLAPEEFGFAASLARPGGNITGTVAYPLELIGKSIEVFRELHPRLRRLALLLDTGPFAPVFQREAARAAQVLGIAAHSLVVSHESELPARFAMAERLGADGLFVSHDLYLMYPRVAVLAAAHRLPVMYPTIPPIREGGLVAVAPDLPVVYQSAANIVARLLAGARPEDTPIEQPTRYAVGINLRTAKALGMPVPISIRLRATLVVE